MRMIHTIAIIFLTCLNSLKGDFTVYNCTGKPLDIQFFYGNTPANSAMQIPIIPQKSEQLLPWKIIIPSFKLFKRRSFLIAADGLKNILTFGPYWLWCSDKTFIIREKDGSLVREPLDKD